MPIDPDAPTRDPSSGHASSLPDPDATAGYSGVACGVVPPVGGRYTLGAVIARGGMGVVHRAEDAVLGREVAVKVLQERFGPASGAAGRFADEARITAQLQHPGIPPVHDLGTLPDGRPFLAMKLVRGRTLHDLLQDRPDPGADRGRFLAAFEQVCQAVGYAHANGVIHRDLKPANIMVGVFGEVQVMDWGLAKVLAPNDRGAATPDPGAVPPGGEIRSPRDPDGTFTRDGSVMGTPAFMPPEQATGAVDRVDARSDVFGLGAVLAVILTGKPPFPGSSAESVALRAAAGDVSEASARLGACGADPVLIGLARRCLDPDPAARPADGNAVAAEVGAYRAGVEERLRAAERERAAAQATAREQRKRRRVQLALAAAVGLVVVGGGSAGWLLDRQDGARREAEFKRQAEDDARQARAAAEDERRGRRDRDRRAAAEAAVAALLDQAGEALRAENPTLAGRFLDQAAGRADEAGVPDHAARLAAYRAERNLLVALAAVDNFRWSPLENGFYPSNARVATRWAEAFAGNGLDLAVVAPAAAAARINGSPARDTVVAALDRWLAVARAAPVAAVLAAADPDPFRGEVRRVLVAGDRPRLAALATRPEWATQPPGLVRAYATAAGTPEAEARGQLARVLQARPTDFGLLMDHGRQFPINTPASAGDRLRWFQAAVGLRPDSPSAHNSLGIALRDKGLPGPAAVAFREAVRLDPKDAVARANLGIALHDAGDDDGAIAAYREAVRLAPGYDLAHLNLGHALVETKDLDGAGAAYREVIRLDPKAAAAHRGLGNVLRQQGKLAESEAAYQAAARLDPKSSIANVALGNALLEKKDLAGAGAAYRDALRNNPTDPYAHNGLGNVLRQQGKLAEAEAAYREAIRLNPKSAVPHNNLGVVLRATGNEDAAVRCYREAIRLDPLYAQPHLNLGNLLYDRRDLDGAAAAFREAIRLDPKDHSPHTNLGNVLRTKGDTAAALAEYREAIRLNPKSSNAHNGLGNVLRDRKMPDAAVTAYREAIRLNPNDPSPHNGLGIALRQLGKLDEAAAAYREAIRLDPEYALPHNNLGALLEGRLDLAGAEAAYREAVRINPKYAVAHANLGDVYLKWGRLDDAAAAYRTALAILPTLGFARAGLDYTLRVQRGEVPTAPPPREVKR